METKTERRETKLWIENVMIAAEVENARGVETVIGTEIVIATETETRTKTVIDHDAAEKTKDDPAGAKEVEAVVAAVGVYPVIEAVEKHLLVGIGTTTIVVIDVGGLAVVV